MIYRAENLEMTVQALEDFIAEWKPKYKEIMESLENTDNLLTFYQFPYQIWHSIYSTNLIESLNKEIKRKRTLYNSTHNCKLLQNPVTTISYYGKTRKYTNEMFHLLYQYLLELNRINTKSISYNKFEMP